MDANRDTSVPRGGRLSMSYWRDDGSKMLRRVREVVAFLKDAIEAYLRHNTPMMAAALAFYTLLSLAPGLWVVVAMAGMLIGRESARAQALAWATDMVGPQGASFVKGVLDSTVASSSLATAAGVASMIFGATIAFGALQDSLNVIWEVPSSERGYLHRFFFKRLWSFCMVLAVGILLLASLLLDTAIAGAGRVLPQDLPTSEQLLRAANFAVSLVLITVLFAVIYKIVPDTGIEWRDVWTSATVTSFLFSAGKIGIGLYLGRSSVSSAYGAAGSLVVLLLWVYYSAQIFLLGAELTEVYAKRQQRTVAPGRLAD